MKRIFFLSLFFIVVHTSKAQYGEVIDISDALQNTLDLKVAAIKIAKNYIYKALKVNYVAENTDETLSKSEIALTRLEVYSQDHPEFQDNVNKLKKQWRKSRFLGVATPKRKYIPIVYKAINDFFETTNQIASHIKKTSNLNIIEYQQASIEMEILAQQLAFLYSLKVIGFDVPELENQIKKNKQNFQINLDKTFFAGENTIEITQYLKAIQADWEMFKQTVENKDISKSLNTIYILSNKISDNSRKVALLYIEKAKKELKKKKQ